MFFTLKRNFSWAKWESSAVPCSLSLEISRSKYPFQVFSFDNVKQTEHYPPTGWKKQKEKGGDDCFFT